MRRLIALLEFEFAPQCAETGGEHPVDPPAVSCSAAQCRAAATFPIKVFLSKISSPEQGSPVWIGDSPLLHWPYPSLLYHM